MIEFEIADEADQQFATVLDNRRVTIRLRYNVSTDRWSMDLSIDDQPVLHGRRIVTGIDLLAPFNLGIGAIFAFGEKPDAMPNRNNLPRGLVNLYHATEAEMASLPRLIPVYEIAEEFPVVVPPLLYFVLVSDDGETLTDENDLTLVEFA